MALVKAKRDALYPLYNKVSKKVFFVSALPNIFWIRALVFFCTFFHGIIASDFCFYCTYILFLFPEQEAIHSH